MRSMPARSRSLRREIARRRSLLPLCRRGVRRSGSTRLSASYPRENRAPRWRTRSMFRDGTRMDAGTSRSAQTRSTLCCAIRRRSWISSASVYPQGAADRAAVDTDFDPGRFRNEAFFDALYGDCRKGDVAKQLVPVVWLPEALGPHRHGDARQWRSRASARGLRRDSTRCRTLIARAAYPTAGTYDCRPVKDTGRLSMHAYGAAIDLNLKFSNYWLWEAQGRRHSLSERDAARRSSTSSSAMASSGAGAGITTTPCISNTGRNSWQTNHEPSR